MALLFLYANDGLVFIFIKEEIILARIIGPDVFYTLVNFPFVFDLLQIFNNFEWSAATNSEVDQFVFAGWPGSIL